MEERKAAIDELAALVDEFQLAEATLRVDDFTVAFLRARAQASSPALGEEPVPEAPESAPPESAPEPEGAPVLSPMTGIFYTSASPGSAPFAAPGSSVEAGQVVGLIEAMKVFNEVVCELSGTVARVVAESGKVVNPGDVLLYIS